MPMRVTVPFGLVLLLVASHCSLAATPQQIDHTVAKAKEYLYSQQQPDGSWELVPTAEPANPEKIR